MARRTILLLCAGVLVLAGAIALALAVHDDTKSSADRAPARSAAVTPLDALARAIETPGADTPTGKLVARMSLERQVAQLFLVGFDGVDTTPPANAPILRREWGSVLVRPSNTVSATQVRGLTYAFGATAKAKKRVPPLMTAARPGSAGIAGVPVKLQPALARRGLEVIGREAEKTGRQLRGLGLRMTLAPLADVATEGGPAENRAYGLRPGFVARATRSAVEGYLAAKVAPAPGDFPGDGGAAQDPDFGPAPVGLTLPELRVRDLIPFRAVVRTTPAIQMTNAVYVAYDGVTPATILPEAVRGLLRGELGFRGLVVSANLAATTAAYPLSVQSAAVQALQAGCDLLMIPGSAKDQERAYQGVLRAVRRGKISRLSLSAAVRRILALKIAAGAMKPDGTPIVPAKPKVPKPKPVVPPAGTVPVSPTGATP